MNAKFDSKLQMEGQAQAPERKVDTRSGTGLPKDIDSRSKHHFHGGQVSEEVR